MKHEKMSVCARVCVCECVTANDVGFPEQLDRGAKPQNVGQEAPRFPLRCCVTMHTHTQNMKSV